MAKASLTTILSLNCNSAARLILCLSGHNKKGANRTMKVKRSLWEQRNMLGARIKIMWKEQLVDPPIHNKTSVNALKFLVKNWPVNKPVNPQALYEYIITFLILKNPFTECRLEKVFEVYWQLGPVAVCLHLSTKYQPTKVGSSQYCSVRPNSQRDVKHGNAQPQCFPIRGPWIPFRALMIGYGVCNIITKIYKVITPPLINFLVSLQYFDACFMPLKL